MARSEDKRHSTLHKPLFVKVAHKKEGEGGGEGAEGWAKRYGFLKNLFMTLSKPEKCECVCRSSPKGKYVYRVTFCALSHYQSKIFLKNSQTNQSKNFENSLQKWLEKEFCKMNENERLNFDKPRNFLWPQAFSLRKDVEIIFLISILN